MRFAAGLIAGFLVGKVMCAQPASIIAQESAHARQLMNSAQWLEKAWGVYFAGRLHSAELNPLLIEQFRFAAPLRNSQSNTEEHGFLTALFDAAIDSGVSVPVALLEPFEEHWTEPILILLARGKDGDDSLLRLRAEKSRDIVWLTANNLLAARRSQPWFAATVGEIHATHRFTVTDPGDGSGFGGGEGGGWCGDGITAMPKGFPPVSLYTLSDFPQMGAVLLAQGPKDVYYKRTVVPTDGQVGLGSCASSLDRMEIRIGYLAQLRNTAVPEIRRLIQSETGIVYTGTENFEREVDRALSAQEYGIQQLMQAIGRDGLRASGVQLRIVPEVNDRRHPGSGPLPILAPRTIKLDE